jgi:hypothetical protein
MVRRYSLIESLEKWGKRPRLPFVANKAAQSIRERISSYSTCALCLDIDRGIKVIFIAPCTTPPVMFCTGIERHGRMIYPPANMPATRCFPAPLNQIFLDFLFTRPGLPLNATMLVDQRRYPARSNGLD